MQPGGKTISQVYLLCPARARVARVLEEKYRTYRAESIRSIPQRWKASIPWSPCLRPSRRQSTGKLKGRREQRGAAPSVPPCPPLLQSWSPAGAILLLLPPIYRDGRRRQVAATVPSRPRCFPSDVPVTIPFLLSPPLPKGWMPCSTGARVGGYPKANLQGPSSPRDLGATSLWDTSSSWRSRAWSSAWHCQQWHGSHPTGPATHSSLPMGPAAHSSHPTNPTGPGPHAGEGGHRAAGGGDRAMPAGATMPVGTSWALKSVAELCLSLGTQVPTWLKAYPGAEAGYETGRGMAGGRHWGVSRAPQCSAATGTTGDPRPEPQHAPAGF